MWAAQLTEVEDSDGFVRVVVDEQDKDGQTSPVGMFLADILLRPAGEKPGVTPGTESPGLDQMLLALKVVLPVLDADRVGPLESAGWVTPVPASSRAVVGRTERVHGLPADRVSRTVHVDLASTSRLYDRTDLTYEATDFAGVVLPMPASVARPVATETYVVDENPGLVGGIAQLFGCALTFGLLCLVDPDDPPPQRRTRTVVAEGPASVDVTLQGPLEMQVDSLVYGSTLLRATAKGHQELTGHLTEGDGVPPPLSGRPVTIVADWTTSVKLTTDWPPRPVPVPLLVLAAVLVVAVSAGLATITAARRP